MTQPTQKTERSLQRSAPDFDLELAEYSRLICGLRSQERSAQRWRLMTSAVAAAGVMAGASEAEILFTDAIARADDGIDLDADGSADLWFYTYYGYWSYPGPPGSAWLASFSGYDVPGIAVAVPAGEDHVRRFASGENIGASAIFVDATSACAGCGPHGIYSRDADDWNRNLSWSSFEAEGFAGVRLNGHYGWIRLRFDGPFGDVMADGWAYETEPGVAILAGQTVPEPSQDTLVGLGALALGAVALRRGHRRGRGT